jgi:hypothetical protein
VGRPFTIHDDRGEHVHVVRLHTLRWDRRQSDPAFAAAAHRASRVVVARANKASEIGLGLIIMLGFLLTSSGFGTTGATWISVLIWFPLGFAGSQWLKSLASRRLVGRAADVLLADGICPGCSYNLAGLPDAGGLVGCPECGAAWKTTRIARRHDFADHPAPSQSATLRQWWTRAKAIELLGPTSIEDDAGADRPVVSPRLMWPIRFAAGERRERLQAARAAMLRHGRIQRWLPAILYSIFGSLALVVAFQSPIPPVIGYMLAMMLCYTIFLWLIALRGASGIKPEHIRGAMLGCRLCPSCACDLAIDEPTEPADLCTCPECGAAWRLAPHATPPSLRAP